MNVLEFARGLIDIDSTTGREQAAGDWLTARLRALGYRVDEQPVSGGRRNVLATLDPPVVVLSTHYDCVPPHFPSAVRDGRLYGRGSCDAKGILAAQVAASERMRAEGERRVGLLFVVGEERGSDGANVANAAPVGSQFLINGEPTDSRLALATRGNLRVRLRATGRAAHSAAPEQGISAIDRLIDALIKLREMRLPGDPDLGDTFYSIGLIEGGVAPNVIPPHASAEVMFRTIGPPEALLELLERLKPLVELEEILRVPHVRLKTWADSPIETAVFPFTTDIPLLNRWGAPLLFGPGSFLVAHTAEEHLDVNELEQAIGTYVQLALACLRDAAPSAPLEGRHHPD
jgi:acetylornithine deacetylase